MRHVPTVALRELRSLFVSPVAYGVLSLFAVLSGLFFSLYVAAFNAWMVQLQQFQAFDQLQELNLNDHLIGAFFDNVGMVLMFLVPGITMSLYVAEKNNGTEELLLTSPLTSWDIVLGKFAAAAVFVTLLVAMAGALPGLLFFYGEPEVGKTLSGLLGTLLLGWTYVAVGAFASSLTRSQVVSFLICFVLLLVLMLLPAVADLGLAGAGDGLSAVFRWLSAGGHVQGLIQGLVDTADLVYFAVMIGSFLLLTRLTVDSVRWR